MSKKVGQLIIILSISIILAQMKVSYESIKYIQQSEYLSAIWNFLTKKTCWLSTLAVCILRLWSGQVRGGGGWGEDDALFSKKICQLPTKTDIQNW